MRVWGKPSEAVVRLGVARAAVAGAKRQELMQEALQAVLSSDLVDRAGVWMEADAHVPSFEPGMSSDFRGIVADRNGEAVPPECARLPYEAPTLRELLETRKSIEQDVGASREPLMIRALVEMRRALWTPVVTGGRVRGVIFAATRKKQHGLPVLLVESVAAELALASDLEDALRFSRERQQDLASVHRFLTAGSAEPLAETLTTLVESCTDTQVGPGALFAAIGHWESPPSASDYHPRASQTDTPISGAVIKFPWQSGDASWIHAIECEPLRDLWQRAVATRRVVGSDLGGSHTQTQIVRAVAFPLEAEGVSLGVLVAGIARASSSLASLQRFELIASLAASHLLRQRRTEETTRAAALREALLQTSDQAIVLIAADGNIAGLSRVARDLLRESAAALRPEGAAEEWLRGALHANAKEKLLDFPKELLLPNGRVLPVHAVPVGADGQLTLISLGAASQTAQSENSSQAELANVIEWLEEGVVLFDSQQHIRIMNSRFAQIAGLKPEEIFEIKTFDELNARVSSQAADPRRFAQDWSELAHGIESGRRDELELARPAPRVLERAARPILDTHGVLLGRVEIYRDVTAQHVFQSKLLQTEKLASLGQMLTSVVHELSNPLTTILGYAQRLLLRSDARGHSAEARQIYEEAERASTILRQVLLTARSSRPERRGVGVNPGVARTMELQRFGLAAGKDRIELDIDPPLPSVEGGS